MKKLLITLMFYMSIAWGQNDKFSINGLELDSLNSYPIQISSLIVNRIQQNALPYVHVAISSFTSLVLADEKPDLKWIFWIGAVLVFLSTFLAKQHFIADGITGLFLGFAGCLMWK